MSRYFRFVLAAAFFLAWVGPLSGVRSAGTAKVHLPLLRSTSTALPPITAGSRWSDPASWPDNRVPVAGDDVVIAADRRILLDVSPPPLDSLLIHGALVFERKDLNLSAGWIMVHGALAVGSEQQPFANRATITLTASDTSQSVMDMGTRGLLVMGGRVDLFGVAPATPWTQLNAHAQAGTTSLSLKQSVDWRPGDQIAIAPTDFYGVAQTERIQLASVNQSTLGLSAPLGAFRWGRLQYATDAGLSLAPGPLTLPEAGGRPIPTILDERAEVGNLTRNIVIQGADDAAWQNGRFGAHVMVMSGGIGRFSGVELRRVGQGGRTGRYPIHFHGLSYDPANGALLDDAATSFVRGAAIWNSANRCITIHATNGLRIQNNICYDIAGHAIFLEDAVERRNLIEGNLVLKVRVPAQPLQTHDREQFEGGPSGFWLTNPDNNVRRNAAADTQGNGFWMAFPRAPLGQNKQVAILPDRTPHGSFDDNVAHSHRSAGIMLEWVPFNDAGDIRPNKYVPTVGGVEDAYTNRLRFSLRGNVSYKNDGAYRNRVSAPDYEEWIAADNAGTYFAGAGDDGKITRSLVVGASLNNSSPSPRPDEPAVAFASYHSTFDMSSNILINFPFVQGKSSGVFKTHDYYITAVDKGTISNPHNRMINAHPGYRTPPPALRPDAGPNDNWTLSGALWDPYGYWGPAGNYWVYDVPFLTAGATCQPVAPAGQNSLSCGGEYYGVEDYLTDFDTNRYAFRAPIEVIRQNAAGAEIGRWTVGDGETSSMLGNMRHFAARPGGRYVLRFPGRPLPKRFETTITNAFRPGDSFLMAVSFDGSVTPAGYTIVGRHNRAGQEGSPDGASKRSLTAAASLSEVSASQGDRFWQDSANNLVWFKYVGGLHAPYEDDFIPNSDDDLYRDRSVVIYAAP